MLRRPGVPVVSFKFSGLGLWVSFFGSWFSGLGFQVSEV